MTENSKNKRILLFDGFNTYIRSFQVIPIANDDGNHFGGVFGFIRSVKSAVDMFNPSEVIIAWDGPQSGLKRKLLFKEYKANRHGQPWKKGLVRAFDFLSEEQQKENFGMQLKRIKEYVDFLPVKTLTLPYIEADDIIADLVNMAKEAGQECIIYSSDADYQQLISPNVSCYNPITKKLMTEDEFEKKHGFSPRNFVFIKAIKGDNSDNIPGVKGLGEKTAVKLLRFDTKIYNSIEEILEECASILNGNTKGYTKSQLAKYQLLLDNAELLKRNYALMQLQDVDVSIQSKDIIRKFKDDKPNEFNSFKLKMMLIEDRMGQQLRNFDSLSRTFNGLRFYS